MRSFVGVFCLMIFCSYMSCDNPDLDESDVSFDCENTDGVALKDAFDYLNCVRSDPYSYGKDLGIDLSGVKAKPALEWDVALAEAAYNKAKYMAENDFFGHVDNDGFGMNKKIVEAGFYLAPYLNKSDMQNNFESIAAGTNRSNAVIMVKELIIDKGISSLGHRKHLLGMTDFFSDCNFCGIGFYKKPGSMYTYYCCVLIAKHK